MARLADLLLVEDRFDESREAVTEAETILRRIDARGELGKALCVRVALERRAGNAEAARAALEEARTIAVDVGSGPDSELGRRLAALSAPATGAAPSRSAAGGA